MSYKDALGREMRLGDIVAYAVGTRSCSQTIGIITKMYEGKMGYHGNVEKIQVTSYSFYGDKVHTHKSSLTVEKRFIILTEMEFPVTVEFEQMRRDSDALLNGGNVVV